MDPNLTQPEPEKPAVPEQITPQPETAPEFAAQPVTRNPLLSFSVLFGKVVLGMAIIWGIGMFVPSYEFVNALTYIFLYGGALVVLVLGILGGRAVMKGIEARDLQNANPAGGVAKLTASTQVKAVVLGLIAFAGLVLSLGMAVFLGGIFLSVRACELSGSSKCM
jgi:hypothetical protein